MAYSASSLPAEYIPYRVLDLCSNLFEQVQIPFAVGEWPILLVGQGQVPRIWLSVPVDYGGGSWRYLVSGGVPQSSALDVRPKSSKGEVTLLLGNTTLLRARSRGPEQAAIDKLDLRPLGLAIHGDSKGLHLGNNVFTNNTLSGAMIGFALAQGV